MPCLHFLVDWGKLGHKRFRWHCVPGKTGSNVIVYTCLDLSQKYTQMFLFCYTSASIAICQPWESVEFIQQEIPLSSLAPHARKIIFMKPNVIQNTWLTFNTWVVESQEIRISLRVTTVGAEFLQRNRRPIQDTALFSMTPGKRHTQQYIPLPFMGLKSRFLHRSLLKARHTFCKHQFRQLPGSSFCFSYRAIPMHPQREPAWWMYKESAQVLVPQQWSQIWCWWFGCFHSSESLPFGWHHDTGLGQLSAALNRNGEISDRTIIFSPESCFFALNLSEGYFES